MRVSITIDEDGGVLLHLDGDQFFDGGPYDCKELALYWAMREAAVALGLGDFDKEIGDKLGGLLFWTEQTAPKDAPNAGWTRVEDALPAWDGDAICGCERTVPVIVTDGYSILHAYAQRWDDDAWNDNEGNQTTWYVMGRDRYDVGFDVLYWHALPSLPLTVEKDA